MSVVTNVVAWIAAMGSGSALLSLSILSALFSILLAAPALFFFVQTVAARRHRRPEYLPLRAQRVAILMPAHNEEASIERTLTELMAALDEGMTIWVVADNCSDETARLAAELGARVVVRDEPERHGKGYAIERGLEAMQGDPPDVVVILDADCRIDAFSLRRIADLAYDKNRPAQAEYTMAPSSSGLLSRVGAFAFAVRNIVRPRGMKRLGFPVHLAGTGMAFPYPLLRASRGMDDRLVEDLYLGIELSLGGRAPILVEEAHVESFLPESRAAALEQRARWEGGNLGMMRSHLPRILREALRYRRPALFGLALDLSIPPLALFASLISLNALFAALLAFESGSWALIALALLPAIALTLGVMLAYRAVGARYLKASELLQLPLYLLWKVPLYLRLLARGAPKRWRRTERGSAE